MRIVLPSLLLFAAYALAKDGKEDSGKDSGKGSGKDSSSTSSSSTSSTASFTSFSSSQTSIAPPTSSSGSTSSTVPSSSVTPAPSAIPVPPITSVDGDFGVTINGQYYNPAQGDKLKLDKQNTPITGSILFRGYHVDFDFDTTTFALVNYTLKGAPDPERLVTEPTVIFTLIPSFSADQLANPRLSRLEIKDEKVVLILNTNQGSYKIQTTDAPQGGILQSEPELGTAPINITRILGPSIFYFDNPFTGKVNFGNGIDAISPSADPTNYHSMLIGKDSPEAATKLEQGGNTTTWFVPSGGRVGSVFGEDATEVGGVGSKCTSQCQNQDAIQGSLPVPPDPTNPTPLRFRRY